MLRGKLRCTGFWRLGVPFPYRPERLRPRPLACRRLRMYQRPSREQGAGQKQKGGPMIAHSSGKLCRQNYFWVEAKNGVRG
jgi:hypothetical protein